MNEIFERTSIRKFTDKAVSTEDAEKLLKAAMAAPSAGNQQPWEFYVTTDPRLLHALSEATPYAKPMAGAALGVIVCSNSEGARFPVCVPQDLSAAIENLLLEATSLGLGAVWLGVAPEEDRMKNVADVAGLPKTVEPFAMIAVGHPDEYHEPRSRANWDPQKVHWI